MAKTPPPVNNRFAKFTGKCKACGADVKESARCKCGVYFKADGTPIIGGRNAKKQPKAEPKPKEQPKHVENPKPAKAKEPETKTPWYDRPISDILFGQSE